MAPAAEDAGQPRTLIDELLEEQQRLTAVERFSRRHHPGESPAQARYYRDLIPIAPPGRGQQYAFAVDLDLCTGCKACVSACHSLNGLDDDEIWRNIGLIHGGTVEEPYQQTITTACHHCIEPGCMHGCPVGAYEKDDATGIVRHLDDQCIGCQYCVLKCPYDVPKYSTKRGIVRKCDMCHSRLGAGEAPACVQSCPSGAIAIRIIDKTAHEAGILPGGRMLPGAFESDYTKPATVYQTSRSIPENARPADSHALRLEHPHWPLILMLVFTQVAAGIFICASILGLFEKSIYDLSRAPLAVTGFAMLNLGLAVSILHLGRPLGAWRAFLGLRTSWMSREILGFVLFAVIAACFTGANLWKGTWAFASILHSAITPLAAATALLGIAGVFCSVMIYVDTRRPFWTLKLTTAQFFGTMLSLGMSCSAAVVSWRTSTHALLIPALILNILYFAWEHGNLLKQFRNIHDPNHRSALLVWDLLHKPALARIAFFIASMVTGLGALVLAGPIGSVCATVSFLCALASQIISRYFFFTAVVAPRMPGPLSAGNAPHP